jgi:hypothetical protein
MYIKGYLYPISYPKIAKKDIPQSLFWAGYVEGYDILILGISRFYILSYPLSFLEKIDNVGVLLLMINAFTLQNAFFVLLNTEINCEFPLYLIGNILKGPSFFLVSYINIV